VTTFALEGLFDEIRRLTYTDWLGAFTGVLSTAARDALPKVAGMRVVVLTDGNLDTCWQLGTDLVTWAPVKFPVTVVWGRLEPQKATNVGTHGRIVLVPNAADGSVGAFEDAEQPGRYPRPLFSQPRKFQWFVYGRDETRISSARANDHIVESLMHELARNVYLACHHYGDDQVTSPVELGEPKVLKPSQQLPNGVEYQIPATVQSAIVDQFDDLAEFVQVHPTARVTVNDTNPFTVEADT